MSRKGRQREWAGGHVTSKPTGKPDAVGKEKQWQVPRRSCGKRSKEGGSWRSWFIRHARVGAAILLGERERRLDHPDAYLEPHSLSRVVAGKIEAFADQCRSPRVKGPGAAIMLTVGSV